MSRVRSRLPLLLLAAAMPALLVPSPASADETVATVTRPTMISAYGGRLAWSSFDAARGRYSLMTRAADGTVSTVPVRPRSVPFDVDLGPNRSGGVVAAYSRCRHDPPRRDPALGNAIAQLPAWAGGRGCDVYRFDFTTRRESRIAAANSRRASEFLPSVWKGKVAFARVYERRAGRAGKRAHLYLRPLRGPGGRSLLAGIRSTQQLCTGRQTFCRRTVEPGPTAIDLVRRRLALAWDSGDQVGPTSNVYLERIQRGGVRKNLLLRESSGDIQGVEIVGAAIDSGRVNWGLTLYGDTTRSTLRRFVIADGARDEAVLPPTPFQDAFLRPVLSSAVSGSTAYYLLSGRTIDEPGCSTQTPCQVDPGCTDTQPCQLRRAEDLSFTRLPRR